MTETAAPELAIEHVCKSYGATIAVNDVTLTIERGEFVTVLGPSGSGKTTLLHMIAGFGFPDTGNILYRGVDVTYMPAHLRNMGMVFQNYALFPHMSVAENLAFPLRMRRMGRGERRGRVREVLDLVGLSSHAAHLPSQLSGGQQQRVAVARALVYRPSLLLMDEPLGALDKALRGHLQAEIKRIQEATGVTILFVTHDQQEALSMSDRIAVMAGGHLCAVGAARELYERPPSRFIAGFVGECNFLPGRVVERRGDTVRISLGDGIMVHAKEPKPATGRVTLCVRPESVACSEPEACGAEAPNEAREAITATIENVVYLGDIIRYELALGPSQAGPRVSSKMLRTSETSVLSRGAQVSACWNIRDVWLMPDEHDELLKSHAEESGGMHDA